MLDTRAADREKFAPGTTVMAFLAGVIHRYYGHAGRLINDVHVRRIDPMRAELVHEKGAVSVVANAADELDVGAQARRGDGLVGALTAGLSEHALGEDRFAGFRRLSAASARAGCNPGGRNPRR